MNIGIICEYNPFHFGHLYHLRKIKELYPNCNIILVLSGWICERGDLSIMDKFKKCEIALHYGIDLVVELPFKYMQSADYFAKGSVEILNKLGCNAIVFGSECNDIEKLKKVANIQLNNKEFDLLVKKYTSTGINYPTALSKSIKDLLGFTINTPNDLLGISYIKEIIKNKYNIIPISIKRDSNFNSKEIEGKITSSQSIRELLKNNKSAKKYVPLHCYKYIDNPIFIDDYYDYLKYKIISEKNLLVYGGIDEKICNRINNKIIYCNNFDELIESVKTKNYTYNRIKRILTNILFSITKEDLNNLNLEYIRILGFNNNGKKILNTIKKNIDIPLVTNYSDKYLSKDLNINRIISLNKKIISKIDFIEKEYKQKPIVFDNTKQ